MNTSCANILPIQFAPDRRPSVEVSSFDTSHDWDNLLQSLLEAGPLEIGRTDIAVLNLLCAPALSGSEQLDIHKCLARLDRVTAFVKAGIDRNLHRFPSDPQVGNCESKWRMLHLVTMVKRDFGAAYNPLIIADKDAGVFHPLVDSRDIFIHGVLDDDPKRRWGTCATLPVLVTAVARRLGYPVGLAVAGRHIYARWESDSITFNVETTNKCGVSIPSDEEFVEKITSLVPGEENSGYYRRTLTALEEFALFMTIRAESLIDTARYEETLLWSARALQFAPDDPRFPYTAHYGLDLALKHRLGRAHPELRIPPADDPRSFLFNIGDLLRIEERSLCMTIIAHFKEAKGELAEARDLYEDACRYNFFGNNEQRDLQRFLKKHRLPPRRRPYLPPKSFARARHFKLLCQPHEEADLLWNLAAQFERDGELVKARNALRDLYLFDPGNSDAFGIARSYEKRPEFQEQLKAWIKERQRHKDTGATAN